MCINYKLNLFILVTAFGMCGRWALAADTSVIPNFKTVTSSIFRGGNPIEQGQEEASFEVLRGLGVSLDIDLQGGDSSFLESGESAQYIDRERLDARNAGISFVNLPLSSHQSVSAEEEASINKALSLLKSATPQQHIFVHCEHGEDRTGLVIALYRVLVQKWTRQASHDEWVADGHGTLNQVFTGELDRYFNERTNGQP